MKLQTLLVAAAGLAFVATPAVAQSSADAESAFAAGFGGTVAISGDNVLVGESGNVFRPGMIYIYERDGSGQWAESGVLTDEANRSADRFSGSMAIDGRVLLASVNPRSDDPASVVSFYKGDDGNWAPGGQLPHETMDGEGFGAALALSGSQAFVGAPGGDEMAGAVYVYTWSEDGWAETAKLEIEDGVGTGFGGALAAQGSDLLVGAPSAGEGSGAVYHFRWTEEGWSNLGPLPVNVVGEDPRAGAAAGSAPALHGRDQPRRPTGPVWSTVRVVDLGQRQHGVGRQPGQQPRLFLLSFRRRVVGQAASSGGRRQLTRLRRGDRDGRKPRRDRSLGREPWTR